MSAVERLALLITADGNGAIREFQKVGDAAERELGGAENRADRLGSRMTSAGVVMMSASAVMAAGMWNVGKSAAALEQAVGGSEAVFKDSAGALKTWAKGADQAAGLSEEAALRLTTRLGGALKGLGYEQEAAAQQSMELAQIAADLAATYGGTTADAVQALGAAYRGEFDPAEQFNLFLKQSTVDAKAVEMGLAKSTSQVDQYARAQATTALILEQSQDAQGQFARELDTTSGQLAVATAEFENAKAQIGAGFLPVMAKAGEIAGGAATGIKSADEATGGLLSTTLGVGTVVLGAAGALSFLGGQAIKARDQFKSARDAVQNFSATHSNLVNGLAAGAIVVGGLVAAYQIWQQAIHGTDDQIKAIGTAQRQMAADASFDQLKEQFAGINDEIGNLSSTIDNSSAPWDADYRAQLSFMGAELEAVNSEIGNTIGVVEAVSEATGANREQVLAWVRQQQAAGIVYSSASSAIAAYTGNIDLNTMSVEEAEAAQAGYAQSLRDAASAAKAATDPFFATLDATQQLAEAQRAANEAAATYVADSPEVLAANEAVARAALGVEGAYFNLAAQMQENGATTDEMKATFARWVEQGFITKGQAEQLTTAFGWLTGAAENYAGDYSATVAVNNFQNTWNALYALNVQLGQYVTLAGRASQVLSPGLTAGVPSSMAPARAAGGPVDPWSVYQVHDTRNPEFLQTPSGSYVLTGSEGGMITNLGSGGGAMTGSSGAVVNLNVTLSGGGPDGGGSALLNFLRQNQGEVRRAIGV